MKRAFARGEWLSIAYNRGMRLRECLANLALARLVLGGALLLGGGPAHAENCPETWGAWVRDRVRGLLAPTPMQAAIKTGEGGAVDAFVTLQSKGYFLEQNASYLKRTQCGGTCASIASVNNMLVMAETLMPGTVSRLSRSQIRKLHQRLLGENLGELQRLHTRDGTKGAHLGNFTDVYPEVFRRVFDSPLAKDVSVVHPGPVDFQSVLPGKDSLLTLSVHHSNGSYHAVVVTGIRRPPAKSSPENPFPEEFIATISDPHAPGNFKDLKVYEVNDKFYLEGYGGSGNQIQVESYGRSFAVNAGAINDGILINFKRYQASREWSDQAVNLMLGTDGKLLAKVMLKDGTVYNNVSVYRSSVPGQLFFFHQFTLKKFVPLDELADLQPMLRD